MVCPIVDGITDICSGSRRAIGRIRNGRQGVIGHRSCDTHCIIGNFLYGCDHTRYRISGTTGQSNSDLTDIKALLMSWLCSSFDDNIQIIFVLLSYTVPQML